MAEGEGFWFQKTPWLNKYRQIYSRQQSLPKWTSRDVNEFISSDPVYGPQLKLTRDGARIAAGGSVIGAASTAAIAAKYSKNGLGTFLSLIGGTAFGWVFGKEVANHSLQLYNFDSMDTQLKFFEWWENKSKSQS